MPINSLCQYPLIEKCIFQFGKAHNGRFLLLTSDGVWMVETVIICTVRSEIQVKNGKIHSITQRHFIS